MPIPKINITNPEAIELIRKIQSGEIYIPIKAWWQKYKWFTIAGFVIVILLIALAIGKKASEKTPLPVFIPPEIEDVVPTEQIIIKSEFSALKEEIQSINTDLPDPFIPVYDNAINLEEAVY
ncbi:MAG TPA: hypothetical protein VLH94_03700 [Spirochaetia bacterium]|nr:hypothetical protein [Spirochaetia bacterium]